MCIESLPQIINSFRFTFATYEMLTIVIRCPQMLPKSDQLIGVCTCFRYRRETLGSGSQNMSLL